MNRENSVVKFSSEAHSELRAYASSIFGWVTNLMVISGKN